VAGGKDIHSAVLDAVKKATVEAKAKA